MALMSTRLPPEMEKEIDWYAKKEQVGKTVALRKILDKGLKEIKLEHALDEYKKGRVTLWKAAEIAGVSLWEMIDVVKERKIPVPYTLEDLKEDLAAVFKG
jgi:predicted HTH domain antitoxin